VENWQTFLNLKFCVWRNNIWKFNFSGKQVFSSVVVEISEENLNLRISVLKPDGKEARKYWPKFPYSQVLIEKIA